MTEMSSTITPNAFDAEPPELDVSKLPANGFDWFAPLWWGNLLMMIIETVTIALLIATYFYLMRNEQQWPPPRVGTLPVLAEPLPDLGVATVHLSVLILSCVPTFLLDRWARRDKERHVLWGCTALAAIAAVSLVLRYFELFAFHFWWNDNAYASIVWIILILHLIYIAAGLGEYLLMAAWIVRHGLDTKHALDVTLVAFYWYWTVGVWMLLYLILFWVPRWI